MNILDEHLKNGTSVYQISYVGFTKVSCNVACKRGAKYAPILLKDKLWFRTIHSTAYALVREYWKQNHLPFKNMMDWKERNAFCKFAELTEPQKDDDVTENTGEMSTGSSFFATATFMTNSQRPIEEWQTCPHATAMLKNDIDFPTIYAEYIFYKKQHNLIDFDDMLQLCYELKLNPPTTVLIVDEAQDLSPLQYAIINNWKVGKTHIYMGGDDDQCIMGFQGADSNLMLNFQSDETLVLPKTYRCPKEIWNPANTLISRNKIRQPKQVEASNQKGSVKIISEPTPEKIIQFINPKVECLVVARTNKLVNMAAWLFASKKILFTYTDQKKEDDYGWTETKTKIMNTIAAAPLTMNKQDLLLDLLTKAKLAKYNKINNQWEYGEFVYKFMQYYIGMTIDKTKIKTRLGTIHSVKGDEATIVIVFNDITQKVMQSIMEDEKSLEDERKVWYVAITRSKLILVIVDGFFAEQIKGSTFGEIVQIITPQNQKMECYY